MKRISVTLLLAIALIGASCSSTTPGIFSKKTPHEKYAEKLDDQDLDKTPQGRQWLAAAKAAVEAPHAVELPYKQVGYFQTDKPRALGLKFTVKRGEQLLFTLKKNTAADFVVYADLFKQNGSGVEHLLSSDTNAAEFSMDIDEAGTYVLRLQPELVRTGEYSLSIFVGPSLAFPVSGTKAKAGSFWGASRDGGKRSHEGIDIFAPKGTPAVASADGVITGVKEGGIGGKVVWMRPEGKNYHLYYAHLDKQLVQPGQVVKKGDVVGTVGNTGNARTTPAHLHFGVYTFSGPVDPYPFVNKAVRTAPAVPEKSLANYLRLTKAQKVNTQTIKASSVLVPLAVTSKGYISESPEGTIFLTPFTAVQSTGQPIRGVVTEATAINDKERKRSRSNRG
jgi:murein DD-endopeptidase MepM/ murein hydrolase activator NlpD